MVLISQGNNTWIEAFNVPIAAIADQASRVSVHVLTRAGTFLGCSVMINHTTAVSTSSGLMAFARHINNDQLLIGDALTTFETVAMNDSSTTVSIGEMILVFMRSRGG